MECGFRTHALTPRPGDYLHAGHGRGSQTRVHKATASTPTIAQEQTACIYRAVIFIQRGKKKKQGKCCIKITKKMRESGLRSLPSFCQMYPWIQQADNYHVVGLQSFFKQTLMTPEKS